MVISSPVAPVPALAPYDGVLLVSFGGPEGHDEVMPFLERVTAGRGIPAERLEEVASHYHRRGGISPINAQNRALVDALAAELATAGEPIPVRLGNRNSPPFLADTIQEFVAAGHKRLLAVLTSAYSSYSSCRQYRENLADAVSVVAGAGDLVIDKIAPWHGLPAFVEITAGHVLAALADRPPHTTRVLGVTHSIPQAMNDASGPPSVRGLYLDQHERVLAAVGDRVRARHPEIPAPELVYCSRSGPPSQPWLEPDVSDRLRGLAQEGVRCVVLTPIGFVSDHMEVVSDLDTDAVAAGEAVGVEVIRVPTVGTDPRLVRDLVALMADRAAQARGLEVPARTILAGDQRPAECEADCCASLRGPRPALCGVS